VIAHDPVHRRRLERLGIEPYFGTDVGATIVPTPAGLD
jgi:hypothetical protein